MFLCAVKPLTLVLTSIDRICKPEVETVPQTGSTNNLATETNIDAVSMTIPVFCLAGFSLVYMPTLPDASFTLNFKMADGHRK